MRWPNKFVFQLDEENGFDSGPFNQGSHWAQAAQIEPVPPTIHSGQATSVGFNQSQTHIRFIYPVA